MAVYKVPQDVEAEDKLIGPFSFRQFIYILIAVGAIALAWGMAQIFVGLALIPLPVIIFFGALALPLRKDQPMEIYLAALLSFYLKPRKRLWQPDGIQSLVEITAPKVIEIQRTKDLSQTEAEQRLSYLASLVDSGGWAVRGVPTPAPADSAMQNDEYFAAQQTEDILDTNSGVARSFGSRINQTEVERHEEMLARLRQPAPQPPAAVSTPEPYAPPAPQPDATDDMHLAFNPYPHAMHQAVISPLGTAPAQAPPTPASEPTTPEPTIPQTKTSETTISPDIINLANNADLSIETIAHEANRIQQKKAHELPEDEVVISLR